jgi:hypothetical protein
MAQTVSSSPNGGAWAAILAAAIGCASFGLFVDLAEASQSISHGFSFYSPTGDLSGKSTLAILVWLTAWTILHLRWKSRDVRQPWKLAIISVALVALAILATFPPFFELFAPH